MIKKEKLESLYLSEGMSMKEISERLHCSLNKVCYWLQKHGIQRRSISEAVYLKNNPDGDPFRFQDPRTIKGAILFGMGIGLYWGEGTKANKSSVRLGNTDPDLVEVFIRFLEETFTVKRSDLHFSLQIFSDMSEEEELEFWTNRLKVEKLQFYKTTITPYRSIGTYRKKTKHGVIIVYYHNRKLRDYLVNLLKFEGMNSLNGKNKPL
jgi:hypothetical protein